MKVNFKSTWKWSSAAAIIAVLAVSGYALAKNKPKKLKFGLISPEARDVYMRHAQVWLPGDIASRDILVGPGGKYKTFEHIQCAYVDRATHEIRGASPKFFCKDRDGDEF